jgi:glutamyl-tRNA reductase
MAVPSSLCDRLVIVGVDHRTGSLDLRDRLFVEDAAVPAFLQTLTAVGIPEAMVLSTCDRVEVVAFAAQPDGVERIAAALAGHAGLEAAALTAQLSVLRGAEALRHVFAVASSLESQVIGEPQVLGQVKAAHRLARAAGLCGADLETILQAAYSAAKQVRSETAIGEGPVSLAAAARRIARDLHGDLGRSAALMVGVGDMGELIAESLVADGLKDLTVVHAAPARAGAVAERLNCHLAPLDDLARLLPGADIVIAALGARQRLLTEDKVRLALQARRRRPIFLIDAAVPGDIEPAVERLDGAFLYDLADLEGVALEGRAGRASAATAAWAIVDSEATQLMRGHAERTAVPSLIALRRHFEEARRQALAAAKGDAEEATRLLVNRLLHDPSEAMRAIAASSLLAADSAGEWEQLDAVLRRLFRLDEDGRS